MKPYNKLRYTKNIFIIYIFVHIRKSRKDKNMEKYNKFFHKTHNQYHVLVTKLEISNGNWIYWRLSFLNSHSGGVESKLGPLGTSATEWPIVPAPVDYDDGEFGRMKIGRGNRSTRRKPAPAPLCPTQIPLDQTRARTRAAAVGSQRLTAWAMARHFEGLYNS
jgi:hypothetical protein